MKKNKSHCNVLIQGGSLDFIYVHGGKAMILSMKIDGILCVFLINLYATVCIKETYLVRSSWF